MAIYNHNSKFDVDLKFGQEGEEWLVLLAKHQTIEVKRDRVWSRTGNLYFEYHSYGKPSGFAATEADYFAYILCNHDGAATTVFLWKTDMLKDSLRKLLKGGVVKTTNGGDDMATKGVIVPMSLIHKISF